MVETDRGEIGGPPVCPASHHSQADRLPDRRVIPPTKLATPAARLL